MPAAHMLTVSLPIEILRTRPRLIFWLATLSQAAALGRGADAVLFGAARRTRRGAGGRPRVQIRLGTGPAAGALARRDRAPRRRRPHDRRLSAVADLHRRDLLGGVPARTRDHRRSARGAGRAADGRHFGVHDRLARFRARHPDDAALGIRDPVSVARNRRGQATLLVRARRGVLADAADLASRFAAVRGGRRVRPDQPAGAQVRRQSGGRDGGDHGRLHDAAERRPDPRLWLRLHTRPGATAQGRGRRSEHHRLGAAACCWLPWLMPAPASWWCWQAISRVPNWTKPQSYRDSRWTRSHAASSTVSHWRR